MLKNFPLIDKLYQMLEYQFEVKPKKKGIESEESPFTTEKMGYWDACDFCDELNRKGIHYQIVEIDSRCNSQRRLTSKLFRGRALSGFK